MGHIHASGSLGNTNGEIWQNRIQIISFIIGIQQQNSTKYAKDTIKI